MLEGLIGALGELFTWPGPLVMFGGIIYGLIIGILPGLGGAAAVALLIPVSFGMDPTLGIILLLSAGVSSGMGGQITAILVNVPGDPPNAATTFDGYAMTKQGRAAEAMGAATAASVMGAIIGTVLMLAMLPLAREFVLAFSYPEFFMIAFSGIVMIATLTRGSPMKGLISAGLGLMLAFIGLSPITGRPRFVFDQLYLWDGIDPVVALIGLFAGAEVVALFASRSSPQVIVAGMEKTSRFVDGIRATFRHWRTLLESSLIGYGIGLVPGVGGTVAAFMAYGRAARRSTSGEFGSGAVEGVIASESANDADKGGALLPTVAFGIPGGTLLAVILTGLLLHGVTVGPNLLRNEIDVVYLLALAMLVPRLIAAVLVWALGGIAARLALVRGDLLAPLVAIVSAIGVYTINREMLDVAVAAFFGYVGYAMERQRYSRVALVIALVLGSFLETTFHQTRRAFGMGGFVTRPIALTFFVLTILAAVGPFLLRRSRDPALLDTEDE
jgi:putative tricarboxylic transport membrane protein